MPAYRPEIDGLRCLAVVPVVLFHAELPPFPGGYVGVDVFFVISGYLITSILIEEIRADRFTFAGFYERRARRILPALFVVLLASLPFGWLWLMAAEFKELLQSVTAAALSVSNVLFWLKSDYFAQAAELLPLLHTWSLGVEEQFYILFPSVLLLVLRRRSGWAIPVVVGIAAASFLAGLRYIDDFPMMVYFLLPFRAWELMAGSLCALIHLDHGRRGNGPAALAGVVLVLAAMIGFDKTTVFPGWAALLPVAGTVLIILFADAGTWVGRILSLRPVLFIGLISYSLYLWHQPVLAFARHYSADPLSTGWILALIALTFGLSVLSWRYVELPFRHRGPDAFMPQRRTVFAVSIAGLAGLTAVGVVGHLADGFPGRLSPEETRIARSNGWNSSCMYTRSEPSPPLPNVACITNPGQARKVALFGDSVMSSLSPTFAAFFAAQGYEVHQITHSHCTLNTAYRRQNGNAVPCPDFTRAAIDFMQREEFDIVVHAGYFESFFNGAAGEIVQARDAAPVQDVDAVLRDFHANAEQLPGQFILVLPHHRPPVDVRERALKKMRVTGVLEDYALARDSADLDEMSAEVSQRLRDSADDDWLLLPADESLCDDARCYFVRDGQILLSDTLHFTADGAQQVTRLLEPLLESAGLTPPIAGGSDRSMLVQDRDAQPAQTGAP